MIIIKPLHPCYDKVLINSVAIGATRPPYKTMVLGSGLVKKKIRSGAWASQELMYVLAHDGSQTFGYINWMNPGTNNLVKSGTITFTSKYGDTGNGSTGVYDTNLDLATSTKFSQDNAGYEIVVVENTASNSRYEVGTSADGKLRHNMRSAASQTQLALNSATAVNVAATNSDGHFSCYRIGAGSGNTAFYRNNVLFTNTSQVGSVATSNLQLLHSVLGYSNRTIRMFTFGSRNDSFLTDNYNAWDYYFTNL